LIPDLLYRRRLNAAIAISLLLHLIAALIYMLYPREYQPVTEKGVAVDVIKVVAQPIKRKPKLKEPVKMVFNPRKDVGRPDPSKLAKASPSRITEVIRLSDRVPFRNVEINQAEQADVTPLVMTYANLNEPDTSLLSGPVSLKGPEDGRGIVTGRVRVPGHGRNGLSLVDSEGTSTEGLLGGGDDASQGVADDLGMIKFIDEQSGTQRVVYCLDVSSSMGIAGLNKLQLAIRSIRASLLNLKEEDSFNIVTFSSTVSKMSRNMLEANMKNIDKAFAFLREYLIKDISNNLGTDILGAVLEALKMNPTVVVLVTDGMPTPGGGRGDIVTDIEQITDAVMAANRSKAKIYSVGLEMDLRSSPGIALLKRLADVTGGRLKNITRDELLKSYYRSTSMP